MLNKFGLVILLMVVAMSGTFLFFEDSFVGLADVLGWNSIHKIDQTGQVLKIAYLFAPHDLNPFSADPAANARLDNVYEGLVAVDGNLAIKPALAVSYGMVGENEWQLRLRQNVRFHNGKVLSADDVIYSLRRAQEDLDGGQSELIASIDKLEKLDETSVRLITKKPDPLLLNKLAKLPIIPVNFTDFEKPVGTGPYMLTNSENLEKIDYKRNPDYWGQQPYFKFVRIVALAGKNERVDALLNRDVDFLVNVPPDAVQEIQRSGANIAMMPSLEVGFAMFNMKDKDFGNRSLRVAVASGLNKDNMLDLAYGYAKTVNQFVSNGVFGYNPDLKGFAYDQKSAEKEISRKISSFEKLKVEFYYPENLKLMGQFFEEQLSLIGLEVDLKPLSEADLETRLAKGDLPFYYLGWRSDSGDASAFLRSVIHTRVDNYGKYNGQNYSNVVVDKLIEKSETNLNQKERLADLHSVMKVIVEDDVIGVPLFETQSLFAFGKNIGFVPRVDSLVLPADIYQIP